MGGVAGKYVHVSHTHGSCIGSRSAAPRPVQPIGVGLMVAAKKNMEPRSRLSVSQVLRFRSVCLSSDTVE